jgi:exosortase/archaeosortase family protein
VAQITSAPTPPAGGDLVARAGRGLLIAGLCTAGALLIVMASSLRAVETTVSARAIELVTGQTAATAPAANVMVLYDGRTAVSAFKLTSECSVAYLLAAVMFGGAALLLVRRLAWLRVIAALIVAAGILTIVNLGRLTAIGAAVRIWGPGRGFEISHTYLGSMVTFVGTCLAGLGFAAALVVHRRRAHRSIAADR